MENLNFDQPINPTTEVPKFWPLFLTESQMTTEGLLSYAGYVKKVAPATFRVTGSQDQEENIFYDKSGLLEEALQKDCQKIFRTILND
jgi:hypothetical protein